MSAVPLALLECMAAGASCQAYCTGQMLAHGHKAVECELLYNQNQHQPTTEWPATQYYKREIIRHSRASRTAYGTELGTAGQAMTQLTNPRRLGST